MEEFNLLLIDTDRVSDNGEHLLKSVLTNSVDYFLPNCTEEDFKRKYEEFNRLNIVAIACTRKEVEEKTLEAILEYIMEKYPSIDITNEEWYYWEPIHYVAYNMDHEKLSVILKTKFKEKLNVLTIFSENALHVLLEYGKRTESLKVDFTNGWEKKTCHIIPEENDNLVKCAELLINTGIDINHKNIWNESPVIIALRNRFLKVLKRLRCKTDIDIDTCQDRVLKRSARDMFKSMGIDVNKIPKSSQIFDHPKQFLFAVLKNNMEEPFLRYNNEDIQKYSNIIDGSGENTTSGNLLQLCLIKGYIAYQKEATNPSPLNKDIMNTRMLKVFTQHGMAKCVEHLLDNGANIKARNRMFHRMNVFQLAVKWRFYPFLVMLMEHKSNQITESDILDVLQDKRTRPFDSDDYYSKHVLFLLLAKLESIKELSCSRNINYNIVNIMNTVLEFCVSSTVNNKTGMYEDVIQQTLRLGAQLCNVNNSRTYLEDLSYDTLNTHLDQCIDDDQIICYNSIILDNEYDYSEINPLRILYHHEKNCELLNHPALINLIHSKWTKSKIFFYSNIVLHCSFLLILYLYMIILQINNMYGPLFYLFCTFICCLILKELSEIYIYGLRYFCDLMNYIDLIVLSCCGFNIFFKDERAMVSAILLFTLKVLLMLGQIPRFTKYMIIFSSTKYFFEYILFYFVQFFSFALCFFILFTTENNPAFGSIGQILVKLFDSMFYFIGQYDGEIANPTQFPAFARIIVTLFLFCMTIILNNLLVGLIVTDMDIIQKKGKLLRQVKMAKYVVRVERFTSSLSKCRSLRWLCPRTHLFYQAESKHLPLFFDILDGEDKDYLEEMQEKRTPYTRTLPVLCEHIMNKVYTLPKHKDDAKEILEKLIKLEEYLRKR
ncbi:hypothetical protein GWI33_006640 [Rhynchophorus ferrugineus]|uniref:Ion transport domain-containing protein n=1 Tax=Rhynchophorus ferrugineus TaxID=354439 RepID=A0A834IFM4_RHYFE|nr:hypothetical protein GWI33_006640 [Rhynchophorus ferrugineus]